MRLSEPDLAQQEWRKGWRLVLASSLGFSFFSVMMSATGLFMEPLSNAFGWSRTLLSSGPSIASGLQALLGPIFGILVDRYGTRRLTLPGIALTTAAICAFSLLDGSAASWVSLWLFFGVVSVAIKSTAWTTAVVGNFSTSRGLALALTLAGTAVSQTLIPPLGNWLITEFGWRAAFVWLGLGWGSITFVLCLIFFHDTNDKARVRARTTRVKDEASGQTLPGITLRQALCHSALLRVALSNFFIMALTMGLSVHLFPILTAAGVPRSSAAWLVALGGISSIVGKVITGVLTDRFRPNWIGGITLGVAALVFLMLLIGVRSFPIIVVAMLVNGYAQGTKTQITGYLTAGYAGMRSFGSIYSFMSALMALAAGLGPLLAGIIYDRAGGYEPFLVLGTIGCLIGGLLVVTLPPFPAYETGLSPTGAGLSNRDA